MPRDVFEKLRLSLEPTGMCLELGDNSIRYPLGITEDVPVKVGHHFIPVDFMVLEMGEREKPPLVLGRPFLKTVGATIDVGKREIKFDINGKRSSFKLNMFHLIVALLRRNQGRRKSRRRRKRRKSRKLLRPSRHRNKILL
jgi:hypothetical protein